MRAAFYAYSKRDTNIGATMTMLLDLASSSVTFLLCNVPYSVLLYYLIYVTALTKQFVIRSFSVTEGMKNNFVATETTVGRYCK